MRLRLNLQEKILLLVIVQTVKSLLDDTPPLSADDLAELFSGLPNLDEIERRYILRVLEATGNNRKRTAEILRINRKTLYRMAARFQIEFVH